MLRIQTKSALREAPVKKTFMVIALIHEAANPKELEALIPGEMAQVENLRTQGSMGSVLIAFQRRTVFIETFAQTEEEVRKIIASLPFAQFFDIDIYETSGPGPRSS
jgi:muconolactone delta-isomerase